jgi:hypothetical protein
MRFGFLDTKRTVATRLGVGAGIGEGERGAKAAPLDGGSRFVGLSMISAGAFLVCQADYALKKGFLFVVE